MTIIRTIIILIAFCGFTRVNAQNEEKLKAQKIAFITQKLDLTPDESAKFWPLYNQMESDMLPPDLAFFDASRWVLSSDSI